MSTEDWHFIIFNHSFETMKSVNLSRFGKDSNKIRYLTTYIK